MLSEIERLRVDILGLKTVIRRLNHERRMWKNKAKQHERDLQILKRLYLDAMDELQAETPSLSVDLRPTVKIGGLELTYNPNRKD